MGVWGERESILSAGGVSSQLPDIRLYQWLYIENDCMDIGVSATWSKFHR